MLQFPRYVLKAVGVSILVRDRPEFDQRLSEGWFSTHEEAESQSSQDALPTPSIPRVGRPKKILP